MPFLEEEIWTQTHIEEERHVDMKMVTYKPRRRVPKDQPCPHLDLRLLACRTVRKQISMV